MINSHVVDNYKELAKLGKINTSRPMFILVYMAQCPYCQDMKSDWDTFKKRMIGNPLDLDILEVNKNVIDGIKEYNAPLYKNLSNVQYVPSLNLMQNNMSIPYFGDRTSKSLETFLLENVSNNVSMKKKMEKTTKKESNEKKKNVDNTKDKEINKKVNKKFKIIVMIE